MSLHAKSLTELRAMAQAFGVNGIFQKDQAHLIRAIEAKTEKMVPEAKAVVPIPQYDARLMDSLPAKKSDEQLLREYAEPYEMAGVKLVYTDEQWFATFGRKSDEGTLRMPPKHFVRCLQGLMS